MTPLLLAVMNLSSIDASAHRGALLAQAPSPAAEREVTIKALHEELEELEEKRSSIGYVFPALCIAGGVGLIVLGSTIQTDVQWLPPALLIGGTAIAVLSSLWLIVRIVKTITLSGQISDKEEQLRALEAQRVQVSVVPMRGGVLAGLRFSL
jgi:hypothetical protein